MTGLPLNIDWQQILLHLFNFFILTAGLYFLLYKPVKDFMDKREAHYAELDKQAAAALAQAQDLKASYAAQLDQADAEIREKREEAAQAAEKASAERADEARQEAEKILAEARESAQQEHDKMVASARHEIVDLAAAAAEKIVRQSLSEAGGNEAHEG